MSGEYSDWLIVFIEFFMLGSIHCSVKLLFKSNYYSPIIPVVSLIDVKMHLANRPTCFASSIMQFHLILIKTFTLVIVRNSIMFLRQFSSYFELMLLTVAKF